MILLALACAQPTIWTDATWTDAVVLEGARRRADQDGDGILTVAELPADQDGDGRVDDHELKAHLVALGATWSLPGWVSTAVGRAPDTQPAMAWQLLETLRQEIAAVDPTAPIPTREELDPYRTAYERGNPQAHAALQVLVRAADEAGVPIPPEVRNLPPPD